MFEQYQIVQRVKERRGATLLWQVDLEERIAKSNPSTIKSTT
jgi:hypothetical protein